MGLYGTGYMFKYLTNNFHMNICSILPCRVPHNNGVHAFILTFRPLNSQDAVPPRTLHMDTSTCVCQDLMNQSQFLTNQNWLVKNFQHESNHKYLHRAQFQLPHQTAFSQDAKLEPAWGFKIKLGYRISNPYYIHFLPSLFAQCHQRFSHK